MKLIFFALLFCVPLTFAADCPSISAAQSGHWKPIASAPHNGRVIELLQTLGQEPWTGKFHWSRHMKKVRYEVENGRAVPAGVEDVTLPKPTWVDLEHLGGSVIESECVYWRRVRKK